MAVKPIRIRRNVWMYQAEVPVDNTTVLLGEHSRVLSDEVREWLNSRGFDLDHYSDAWTYYTYGNAKTADFFFADPQVAMLFKLTFG